MHPSVTDPPEAPTRHARPTARRPGLGTELGVGSAVYTLCGAAHKAVGLLLLPLYTHRLSSAEYGAAAVVTLVVNFLVIALPLGVTAAVMRDYHRATDPETRRTLLGTLMAFVLAVSFGATALLLAVGAPLLAPLLGEVPFWPLMAIGLVVVAVQPATEVALVILQSAQRPLPYAVVALVSLAVRTALAAWLILGLQLGAEGVVGAAAGAATGSFVLCLWCIRHEIRPCLRIDVLLRSLRYSLPLVPHQVGANARQVMDRMFLLHLAGTAATGVYAIGAHLGSLTQIAGTSTARALTPLLMQALRDQDRSRLDNIANLGITAVFGYCMLSLGLSLFAPELLWLLAGPSFHDAYRVVPPIAFAFVAGGICSLHMPVLLYHDRLRKALPLATFFTLGLGAVLAWLLIPKMGTLGAGLAVLLTQIVFTIIVVAIAHRTGDVRLRHGRIAAMFAVALGAACITLAPNHEVSLPWLAAKVGLALAIFFMLSVIAWRSPLFLRRELAALIARAGGRPGS